MADKVLTRVQGGVTDTIHINTDKFAGVRTMGKSDGSTITVDRTAQVIDSDRKGESRPLLSKVVGGASGAYSLRDLNDKAGNNKVVRVRRASDNAEADFKASEVSNGTLVDWVNTDVSIYQSDFSSDSNGWTGSTSSPVGNEDGISDGTTSKDNVLKLTKNQTSQAYANRNQGVVAGLTYTVSGSVYAPSSNSAVDGILIKDGNAGFSLSDYPSGYLTSNGVWTDFSFTYTATVSGAQRLNIGISSLGSNPNGSSSGSTGDVVYISDLQFVETTSNGFVETWYDQSGNGNDATQQVSGSQPKIVDGGTLVECGLAFDGVNDFLEASIGNLPQPLSGFSVFKNNSLLNAPSIWDSTSATNRIISYSVASDDTFRISAGTAVVSASSQQVDGTTYLRSDIIKTITSEGYVNGVLKLSGDAGTRSMEGLTIGARYDGAANFTNGSIAEIIIYPSDQSANREAIEANINNQYDIY